MIVVDSCGWLEYFGNGPNAARFASAIEALDELLVPSVVLHEVFKHLLRRTGEPAALKGVSWMRQGRVLACEESTALQAAKLAIQYRLATADSLILATAQAHGAELWTQDADFETVPGVRYFPKLAVHN